MNEDKNIAAVPLSSHSEQLADIHESLSKAQGSMPPLLVDTEGASMSGGKPVKFVSLPGIIEHIKKPLADNGLSVTQEINYSDKRSTLITTLRHSSGQWIRSVAPIFFPPREEMKCISSSGREYTKDYNQECGKAISYMRRYALESMLSLKGDRDDYDRDDEKDNRQIKNPIPNQSGVSEEEITWLESHINSEELFNKILDFNKVSELSELNRVQFDKVVKLLKLN